MKHVLLSIAVVSLGIMQISAQSATGGDRYVSFRHDVAPILATGCGTRSCHGGASRSPDFGRHGDAHTMRMALVGIASEERPVEAYVRPGQPGASFLLEKIDGCLENTRCVDHDCGARMPLDNPALSLDARATIRAWVAQGAADN